MHAVKNHPREYMPIPGIYKYFYMFLPVGTEDMKYNPTIFVKIDAVVPWKNYILF